MAPNAYTACETYRGFLIATKEGTYSAFRGRGDTPRLSGYSERVQVRRAIDDFHLGQSR